MLFEVSERLDNKTDIKRLGLKLNVQTHVVNAALANEANSLTDAAHNILKDWFKRQNDRQSAYQVLGQALKASQLNMIANDVLEYSL